MMATQPGSRVDRFEPGGAPWVTDPGARVPALRDVPELMYFSDRATIVRYRADENDLDALRQPRQVAQPDLEIWCRAWTNREGRREGIEAITSTTDVSQIEGFSLAVPVDTDIVEGDRVTSLMIRGREFVSQSLEIRAISERRTYREAYSEVVR